MEYGKPSAELLAQLTLEATEYKSLKEKRNYSIYGTTTTSEPKFQYFVSRAWIKAWKEYVGIERRYSSKYYYSSLSSQNESKKGLHHPGSITNEDILLDKTLYYASGDEEDMYNSALKANATTSNFKILSEKRWKLLYNKYGGVAIKRPFSDSKYSRLINFERINMMVVFPKDKLLTTQCLPKKIVYYSDKETMASLKSRIVKILSSKEYNLISPNSKIRLWKTLDRQEREIKNILQKNADKIYDTKYENSDPDIEANSGIEFPGESLEPYLSQTVFSIKLYYDDMIVVETGDSEGQFIFKYFFLKN